MAKANKKSELENLKEQIKHLTNVVEVKNKNIQNLKASNKLFTSIILTKNKYIEELEKKLDDSYKEQEQMIEDIKSIGSNLYNIFEATNSIQPTDVHCCVDVVVRMITNRWEQENN